MAENPMDRSTDVLYTAIDEYFNWISIELSTYSVVSNSEIYDEIDYLQNKYFRR